MANQKTEALQREIISLINRTTPIKAENGNTLTIENISVTIPDAADDISQQLKMKYTKEGTLEGFVSGKIVVKDMDGKIISRSNQIKELIPFPIVTDRGTYLVKGVEKNILNQMRLKPGAYTTSAGGGSVKTTIMVDNGRLGGIYVPQTTIHYVPHTNDFKINIKTAKSGGFNIDGINFLREIGFNDQEIKKMLGNDHIADQLFDKYGGKKSKNIGQIVKAYLPRYVYSSPQQARLDLDDFFKENAKFNTGLGVVKTNLGTNSNYLSRDVFAKAIQKTFETFKGQVPEDDKDDLRFKDVYDDNDFIMESIEKDWAVFVENAKTAINGKVSDVKWGNIRNLSKVGDSTRRLLSQSTLAQTAEQINPLQVAGATQIITQLGDGGIAKKSMDSVVSARSTAKNSANRVDPVQTPESGKIGLVERLTYGSKIEDRTIKAAVYKVKDGVATKGKANEKYLSADEDYRAKIAFNDSRYVKTEGNTITFIKGTVPARYLGKTQNLPATEIEYIDAAPQSLLGYSTNMIPFVAHDDGNRALMGSNMQEQAVLLKHREAPLVSTVADDKGTTYEKLIGETYGKPVRALTDGVVKKIEDGKIIVADKDNKETVHQFYEYFPSGAGFINNELKVKEGDQVKKNSLLAEGWQTKDGELALGVNARIAYLPFKGYNYEDGIVVSRSFANKMSTDEITEVEVKVPKGWLGGRGSKIQNELIQYTRDPKVRANLDNDGIIKVGQYVKPGDTLVARLKPVIPDTENDAVALVIATEKNQGHIYIPHTIERNSYVEGEVKRITILENPDSSSSQKIIITLAYSTPLKLGDKIAGRHGNKGTITKIIDDDEMPLAADNRSVDLIFSPLAVPSRKNVGQLLEVNAGLVAEKTGKKYKIQNFNHEEKEKVLENLKQIGFDDGKMAVKLREKLPDGSIKEVPVENAVTVGDMYIMKLKHKVDEKIQARANQETSPSSKTNMPSKVVGTAKGEKHNPQALGEMELRALQGGQAVWNVLENTTIKADGGGDLAQRIAMFKAIETGKLDALDVPATPTSLNALSDSLKALGMNVRPINNGKEVETFNDAFDSLAIRPIKGNELLKMTGKKAEVTRPDILNAKDTYGVATKRSIPGKIYDDTAVKGGLADPKIFGTLDDVESRKKWGYIKLATPMPNPIFLNNDSYNPYSLLTGLKTSEVKDLVNGKKVAIGDPVSYDGFFGDDAEYYKQKHIDDMKELGLKPGELVDPKVVDNLIVNEGRYVVWKTGNEVLTEMLDKIDVKKSLKEAQKELQEATKGDDIDRAYKKVRLLTSMEQNGLRPGDFMTQYVPVAPLYLRPSFQSADKKDINVDDLDKLYAGILKVNNPIKERKPNADFYSSGDLASSASIATRQLYEQLTHLTGQVTKRDVKTKRELQGFKDRIGGKTGLVRDQMLRKRVDFSGRSVIGVDPELKLDEVGIPLDMAKYLYKPFILKELVQQGYAGNQKEALDKWRAVDIDTKRVIDDIAKDRPVIINRQPSLHSLSLQAYKPIIKETQDGDVVRSIHLNPLSVEAYNADFDGDQMAVHVPITERAKEEAKKIMMPSDNLINPTDGRMIVSIRHEMALGIYHLTVKSNQPEGEAINYTDYKKLRKDYLDGVIHARQKVTISGKTTTAGSALFNLLIPEKHRDFNKTWNKKAIDVLLKEMYTDAEEDNWKKMSKIKLSSIIDEIKSLGFAAATRSGLSIGTSDFKKMEQADSIFEKNVAAAKRELGDTEKALIQGWMRSEKEIEKELAKGNLLGEDNPLQIMMASGARANPGQIRRMMVTTGVGKDVNDRLISPIRNSHFDGLSPQEYFAHSMDSRKGIYDRSVSTSEPGALTREVWSATQDVIIVEKDCKTRDFIYVKTNSSSLEGRISGDDVVGENGTIIVRKNEMITRSIKNKIYADKTIKQIPVRSPLKCKSVGGVCSYCYGAMPGTQQLPREGTPVGILASQALGEPVTQMTMNTFHSGGTASSATMGLPKVKKLLDAGVTQGPMQAVLASVTGTVDRIDKGITSDIVYIQNKAHVVPHVDGKSQKLKVEKGDNVVKGDFLTFGDIEDLKNYDGSIILTDANPKDILKYKAESVGQEAAMGYVKEYLTDSLNFAFDQTIGSGSVDSRHIETIVGKMTSKAVVLDSGDSNFMKGQETDVNALDKWNAENSTPYSAKKILIANPSLIVGRQSAETYKNREGKVLVAQGEEINQNILKALKEAGYTNVKVIPKPIIYEGQLHGKLTAPSVGHENWFSNLGDRAVYKQLARGSILGQVDKLNDPRARMMAGKLVNIGEGFGINKHVANNVGSKMLDFFKKLK